MQQEICTADPTVRVKNICFPRTEYFIAGTEPQEKPVENAPAAFRIVRPSEGLQLAYDPRIPAQSQAFEWVVDGLREGHQVAWLLNGSPVAVTQVNRYLWAVARGAHVLEAREMDADGQMLHSTRVRFTVK